MASKAYATAQSSAMQDLVKWSLKDENRAIQDALTQVRSYTYFHMYGTLPYATRVSTVKWGFMVNFFGSNPYFSQNLV